MLEGTEWTPVQTIWCDTGEGGADGGRKVKIVPQGRETVEREETEGGEVSGTSHHLRPLHRCSRMHCLTFEFLLELFSVLITKPILGRNILENNYFVLK